MTHHWHALVLGGNSSIGGAIARRLAADGFEIHLTYCRNDAAAREVAGSIKEMGGTCHIYYLDAASIDDLQLVLSAFGSQSHLGVVVNSIGVSEITPLLAPDAFQKWKRCLEINVNFMFVLANATLPILKKNNWGRWINISSVSASEVRDGVGCYSVTKSTQNHLVKFLAREAGPNVTVNSVCPGMTYTPHLEASNRRFASLKGMTLEQLNDEILSSTVTKRFVEPDEIAGAVSYLCSDGARSVTGTTFIIAGGRG